MSLSRRGLLGSFFKPLKAGGEKVRKTVVRDESIARSPLERTDKVAVIQGRHCLAYQDQFCTVCYEQCPVPQAIELNDGVPRIVLETCTGCGICQSVCPAPTNAIMVTERKPGFGM